MTKTPARHPLIFDSVSALMRRLEQPMPQHPLIALLNYGDLTTQAADAGEKFLLNFYKISFKTNFKGRVRYGRGYYDFEEGGLAFLAPNQLVEMSAEEGVYEGQALFFHADLIRNYQLGTNINAYGFFSYAYAEALYVSDKERKIISGIFNAIAAELENNIDHFSQDVLVSQLELLLNYSNRFYNRQFITRKGIYNGLITKMDTYLQDRLMAEKSLSTGILTVQELSDHLKVSPRYLTDMLKSLTGQSTQQYIHNQLIEKAKSILSTSNLSVAAIAYQLGFEHPQSFNKLFKRKTQLSPGEYRQGFN